MQHKFRIPEAKFNEIKRLLKGNLTHRNISRHASVSREVISRVSLSDHYEPAIGFGENKSILAKFSSGSVCIFTPDAPMAKCDNCGVSVKLPCLACQVRDRTKRKKDNHV